MSSKVMAPPAARSLDAAAAAPEDARCPVGSDAVHHAPETLQLLRLFTAVEQAHETIVITDAAGCIQYANPSFERVTGYTCAEAIGQNPSILKSGKHDDDYYHQLWKTLMSGETWSGPLVNRRKDGTLFQEEATISPVRDAQGEISHFVAVKRDVSRQIQLQDQLRQAQKLEAIGQLAAGVAHEINTPTQYVSDNIRFLKESFEDLSQYLEKSAALIAELRGKKDDTPLIAEAAQAMEQADVEYLSEEIPSAIAQSLEGVQRIAEIVRAMKEFSHPAQEMRSIDLNRAIKSTVTVAKNEWKYVAEMQLELDPGLPEVTCMPGEINQVMLNLIVNAAHAIGDKNKGQHDGKGRITIRSSAAGDEVEIQVEDDGCGMPSEVQQRIFDPFFTTKEVGKGTGQGLSIAYTVVTKKHGGTIRVDSEEGGGTRFWIRLPVAGAGTELEDVS
ncbi:MAG: PAS domain S-box protein [bacterium]|nr:PAS domain S-box protein [bacterium]